jgi:hypothetical protein
MVDTSDIKAFISNTLTRIFAKSNTSGVQAQSVNAKAFSLSNRMIPIGTIQLNKISPHMTVLPGEARAEVLVAPQDLAKIDGRGLDTFSGSIERIKDLQEYCGLQGMRLSDHSAATPTISYEHDLYRNLARDFAEAWISGRDVTTSLFLPTEPLLRHIYAERGALRERGGEAFIPRHGEMNGPHYWTGTEVVENAGHGVSVRFTNGQAKSYDKENYALSARPVALRIQAPSA